MKKVQVKASQVLAELRPKWFVWHSTEPADSFSAIRTKLRRIHRKNSGMNKAAKLRLMRNCDPQFAEWGEQAQNSLIRQVLRE